MTKSRYQSIMDSISDISWAIFATAIALLAIANAWIAKRRSAQVMLAVATIAAVISTIVFDHGKDRFLYGVMFYVSAFGVIDSFIVLVMAQASRNLPPQDLQPPDPTEQMKMRINTISTELTASAKSLREASGLLDDLQEELNGRLAALEELRQKNEQYGELAKINIGGVKALNEYIETRLREQGRDITRVAWKQGAVYAIIGAAVTVALVIFSQLLPTIK